MTIGKVIYSEFLMWKCKPWNMSDDLHDERKRVKELLRKPCEIPEPNSAYIDGRVLEVVWMFISSPWALYDVILQLSSFVTKREDSSHGHSKGRYFTVVVNTSICLTSLFRPSSKCLFLFCVVFFYKNIHFMTILYNCRILMIICNIFQLFHLILKAIL